MIRYFDLFVKWITTGNTIESLLNLARIKLSPRQLVKYFNAFLDKSPQPLKSPEVKYINLKVDAKYFGRWGCCIVFKESENIIFWHFCLRESYHNYLYCFSRLRDLNYVILSVTSDRHGSIISAVKTIFGNIPHQLCLVHIQRRCETLLTKNPKTEAGRALLEIVRTINHIETVSEAQTFKAWVFNYEERNAGILNHRTYSNEPGSKRWWYTHKNLRRAFIHLKASLSSMFFYLSDPNIPKDTNGLEAEFTHLKTKLNIHRGLKRSKRISFTNWYWYIKSTQKFN